MLSTNDCLPTSLFPSTKSKLTNFLDISDTSSISSGGNSNLSRSNSLSLIPDLASPEFPTKPSYKTLGTTQTLDAPLLKVISTHPDDKIFPEDLYERVEEFLDQEGLYLSTPSPFAKPRRSKPSMTVILSTSFLSKSEVSPATTMDGDSPYSDLSAPTFLVRRTISGGFKPNGNLSLLISQLKSEAAGDSVQTPCTVNYTGKLQSKFVGIQDEEIHEIDSLDQ